MATPEQLCDHLNDATEAAGLSVWFESEPSDKEGCCVLRWGSEYAPPDTYRGMEVRTAPCFSSAQALTGKSTWEDFAAVLTGSKV